MSSISLAMCGSSVKEDAVHALAELDHKYVWHPFTQMRDWLSSEPLVITRGKGPYLWDVHGRKYFDANSSIWTNLHGHQHPVINRSIARQLQRISHSSALGLANEPAALLAEKLVHAANPDPLPKSQPKLAKAFFSDDGSTAMEVALKLSYEYWRRNGVSKPRFLSLGGAYHGDTVGAVSLGHIDLFHKAYSGLLFETDAVPAPYCYRCPYNRAKPERADARTYRKCKNECVTQIERKFDAAAKRGRRITAFAAEPVMQGAAGMIAQPNGWFEQAAQIARAHGAHVIADEVMTGFCRASEPRTDSPALFASHQEGVVPDFIGLAKGLTGGYLPMAATLTTQPVFDAFLGEYHEFKTFFHGHSFTANQLGAAAANASLDLLHGMPSLKARRELAEALDLNLKNLWSIPTVGDIRRTGLVAGLELVRNWETREPFDLRERAGIRVCEAMAKRGILTRPVGNVIVIMPPYCATPRQIRQCIDVLADAIVETLGTERPTALTPAGGRRRRPS